MQKNGRLMKKITSILMSILLVFNLVIPQAVSAEAYDPNEDYKNLDVRFWEDEKPEIGFYINAGNRYILETVPEPIFGVTSGEWSVMDLLRGMYTGYDYLNYIPEDYFQGYISRVEKHVVEKKGNLDRNKVTEWARSILTLSSLGYDISDVAGYDYIEKLSKSHKFSHRQGLNGPIWTLIALNTGNYNLYEDSTNPDANTEGKMLDYILDKEIVSSDGTKGGWALWGKTPDTDMTGMALQGLAPYYLNADLYNAAGASKSYEEFQEAVERGVYILSEIQLDNGGYFAWGSVNAESTVQVIVALTALELDPLAENIYLPKIDKTVSFWTEGGVEDGVETNNLMDALITFWASGSGTSDEVGGFKHVTAGYDGGGGSGTTVNECYGD